MKRQRVSQDGPLQVKVDSRGQQYSVSPSGQIRRMASNGTPLPRIKMSKKERLKLRREYREIEKMDQKALADTILETPVINPVVKPTPELGNMPVDESGISND